MLRRLVRLAISLVVWLFDRPGAIIDRLLQSPQSPHGTVLYYHGVKVSQRRGFARQMDVLLRTAHPWNLGRPFEGKKGLFAAVTFDDGFISVVENALPELRERAIPFTVFVPTGSWGNRPSWIENSSHPSWEERVVTPEELCALAAEPLVAIGSHTITHRRLTSLDKSDATRELSDSKNELEGILDGPVRFFSFPHGAYDDTLVECARKSGYDQLFTIDPSVTDPTDPGFLVGRIAVEPDDWPLEFFLKLTGCYRWQSWLRGPRRKTQSS